MSYDFTPRYNYLRGPSCRSSSNASMRRGSYIRRLETASWGLVPGWAKDVKIGFKAFNARSETVLDKRMFRRGDQAPLLCAADPGLLRVGDHRGRQTAVDDERRRRGSSVHGGTLRVLEAA